jgi:hypothetical protein
MKRRAMVIIMASSWAGIPILFPGQQKVSIPSVSCMGDVVSVSMEVPIINRITSYPSEAP